MSAITVILFFVYLWGLGFSASFFIKDTASFYEKNIMRLGIGLGVFSVLGIILDLVNIPIHWAYFLLASLAIPAWYTIKHWASLKKIKFVVPSTVMAVAILIFLLSFFMYHKGAFAYPYLEDDDPWGHASSIKYIALEKTLTSQNQVFQYIDPYPPGYDMLLGILHQTSSQLSWTMKFFNALLISLGFLFFFFFAKKFMKSAKKAMFATIIFAAIPSYLSHFIWGHALVVTLFFPAMYFLEKTDENKKWIYPAAIVIAGIFLAVPTQPPKLVVLLAGYIIIKSIIQKKPANSQFIASIAGFGIALIWWGRMLIRYGGVKNMLAAFGFSGISSGPATDLGVIGVLGTATRLYTFQDFFVAKAQNMINNPIGIGVVISLLTLIGLVLSLIRFRQLAEAKNYWIPVTLFWLLFTFIGIHGGTRYPIALYSFRFWMLFSIPVSLLAGEAVFIIQRMTKKIRLLQLAVLALLLLGIFFTSFQQKYAVNTAVWSPGGGWQSQEELQAYVSLDSLPLNVNIYPLSGAPRFTKLIGFDKMICMWCDDVIQFEKRADSLPVDQLHTELKNMGFEYTILDTMYATNHGLNETNQKLTELRASTLFSEVFTNGGASIFRIN